MTSLPLPSRSTAFASRGRLTACAGILTLALGLAGAVDVPGASAQVRTLHFFQKTITNQFYNAAGQPIRLDPPQTVPGRGDSFAETDLDYVGTAAHHARRWTASDHLTCTFTADARAICDAQIAIGGSLLLATDETIQFGPGPTVLKLNGGTGAFHGVQGTVASVNVGPNSNLTLSLSL